MRRRIGIILVLLSFGIAFSQVYFPEKIKNFSIEIKINKDSSFLIKESIVYDFGGNLKHGIYRDIPLKNIKIKVLKVVDEFDNPYPFEVSKERGYLKIKIGDPKKLITGQHTYNIFYQVFNGLGFFADHDELYWNVTGNEWNVPIEKSQALILLPEKISIENLKFDCFTGPFGSKEKDCSFRINEDGNAIFESKKKLYQKEGLTIVLGWPKGVIKEPSIFQKLLWKIEAYFHLSFLIPIFVFIYLFEEWLRKGKDPKIKRPIVVEYEPPDNLRAAEVSLIMNQKIQPKDIAATLIDLAIRGFIKIREVKTGNIFKSTDYELIKLKDFDNPEEDLRDYERELLRIIFIPRTEKELLSSVSSYPTVCLSSLKKSYLSSEIIEKIYSKLPYLEYFVIDPQKVTKKWLSIGVTIIAISYVLFEFNIFHLSGFSPFLSLLISGVLFLIFSPFMPKRNKKGTETYWKILGFKEYINTAEKYRAQFYEKEKIFEKYLPYAIVFGLTKEWARAFEGIYTTSPSWYEGDFGPAFSTSSFADSIGRYFSAFAVTFGKGRGSGFGGGFSGGGGGGGGGGSW
jgi:uncharacterized membrane protein